MTRTASTQSAALAAAQAHCTGAGWSLTRPAAPAPTPPAEQNEDLQALVEDVLCWFTFPDLRSENRRSVIDCMTEGGSTTPPTSPPASDPSQEVEQEEQPKPSATVKCWSSPDDFSWITRTGNTDSEAANNATAACRADGGSTPYPPRPPQQSSSVTCWDSTYGVCEGRIGSCKPASRTVTRTAATFDEASAAARKACIDSGGSLNRPPLSMPDPSPPIVPEVVREASDLNPVALTSSPLKEPDPTGGGSGGTGRTGGSQGGRGRGGGGDPSDQCPYGGWCDE